MTGRGIIIPGLKMDDSGVRIQVLWTTLEHIIELEDPDIACSALANMLVAGIMRAGSERDTFLREMGKTWDHHEEIRRRVSGK